MKILQKLPSRTADRRLKFGMRKKLKKKLNKFFQENAKILILSKIMIYLFIHNICTKSIKEEMKAVQEINTELLFYISSLTYGGSRGVNLTGFLNIFFLLPPNSL